MLSAIHAASGPSHSPTAQNDSRSFSFAKALGSVDMTDTFDDLLAQSTKKGEATVHGVLTKCVDNNGSCFLPFECPIYQSRADIRSKTNPGKVIYSKIAGYESLSEDSAPLRENAVLQLGSATKFITSIALLQCIENGLVGIDEPIDRILPELQGKEILEGVDGPELTTQPSRTPITARHLLTHMTGLGFWFIHPLLMKWKTSGHSNESQVLTERFNYPLIFEPGQGWTYGVSLDWAGVAISRLHGGITLEEYMVENIWKRVGRTAPFPTFHVSKHPEYEARLMRTAERTASGGLAPSAGKAFCAHLDDDEGGAGLSLTMNDYVAVLQDLVSDSPTLLRPETVSMMFEPQIPADSPAHAMLLQLRPAWDIVAGPVKGEHVSHGLGGLLLTDETPEIRQPRNILCWGGSPNIVWFICKEKGVAGFFATQMSPFGDATVKTLVNAWKKDLWSKFT